MQVTPRNEPMTYNTSESCILRCRFNGSLGSHNDKGTRAMGFMRKEETRGLHTADSGGEDLNGHSLRLYFR